jgi:hypothetical protein
MDVSPPVVVQVVVESAVDCDSPDHVVVSLSEARAGLGATAERNTIAKPAPSMGRIRLALRRVGCGEKRVELALIVVSFQCRN